MITEEDTAVKLAEFLAPHGVNTNVELDSLYDYAVGIGTPREDFKTALDRAIARGWIQSFGRFVWLTPSGKERLQPLA